MSTYDLGFTGESDWDDDALFAWHEECRKQLKELLASLNLPYDYDDTWKDEDDKGTPFYGITFSTTSDKISDEFIKNYNKSHIGYLQKVNN